MHCCIDVLAGHICHICQICDMNIWGMYAYICQVWSYWHQPFNQKYCTQNIWNTSLNQCGCHIPNMPHMDNILHGHIDPTFSHKYTTTKWTATYITNIITKYVPEKNMTTKLGIGHIYLPCIYRGCMHIYMPHVKLLVQTIKQGMLYTFQIYHCTSMAATFQI